MPFINAAIEDAKEDRPVEEGEYTVRVAAAEVMKSKKGKDMVHVTCVVEGEDNASPIHHYIILPAADDEHKAIHLRNLKRFLVAFSVPHEGTGFDTDDLVGATAKLLVGQRTLEGTEGRQDTTVNELRLPRVQDEPTEQEGSQQRRRRA